MRFSPVNRLKPSADSFAICSNFTDFPAKKQEVSINLEGYARALVCAVMALKNWCEKAGIKSGFVFRSVNRHQQVSDATLTPRSVNLIIKSVATECKLPDAEKFSGHSLRRGFATCASKSGASFVTIMRYGRWRHEGTVLGYIEEGQQFEDNAVSIILKRNVQQQTG